MDNDSDSNTANNSTYCSDTYSPPKFRAQRKFAENSAYNFTINERSTTENDDFLSQPGTSRPLIHQSVNSNEIVEVFPNINIESNDFITFLCLRGSKYLPDRINFDNPEKCKAFKNVKNQPASQTTTTTTTTTAAQQSKSKIIDFAVRKSGEPTKKTKSSKKIITTKKSKQSVSKSKTKMRLRSNTITKLPAQSLIHKSPTLSSLETFDFTEVSLQSKSKPKSKVYQIPTQQKRSQRLNKKQITRTKNSIKSLTHSTRKKIEPKAVSKDLDLMPLLSSETESESPEMTFSSSVRQTRVLRSKKNLADKSSPPHLTPQIKRSSNANDSDFYDSDEEPLAIKIRKNNSNKITKLSIKAKCQHDKVNEKKNKEHIEKWLKDIPHTKSHLPPVLKRETQHSPDCNNTLMAMIDPKLSFSNKVIDAPVFEPTEKEFQNPIEYIENISKIAEKYGICRIIPPATFKPECKINDDMRFYAYNHYVGKMLNRWGPNTKLLAAIKECLPKQDIKFQGAPLLGSMEADLARLYNTVQSLGGLRNVIMKHRWPKVVELMKVPKAVTDACKKLDALYCKYLLLYETLSLRGKSRLLRDVENEWNKKSEFRLQLAKKRTHINVESDEEDNNEDDEEFKQNVEDDSLECIIKGNKMPLRTFYRIARNTINMFYENDIPNASQVENDFWKYVTERENHICVYSGSIDSGGCGYGFITDDNSVMAKHPWNLKVLTNNELSILKAMGPVMGLTVPTLHVGMLYTACCWYRDPHGLPWIEYLHTGADKIWYGIPDSFNDVFQAALLKLVPSYCRNKTIWLPSDTAMVPPNLLINEKVAICRTVQKPGEFIVVFPKAFTSNICTGYVVSESVYFATSNWLINSQKVFEDITNSCEPSMFSLARLLLSLLDDSKTPITVLKMILPNVQKLREQEYRLRNDLNAKGVQKKIRLSEVKRKKNLVDVLDEFECHFCRKNLYVSMIAGTQEDFIYCLTHALQYLKKKKLDPKLCRIQYNYSIEEIDNLIQKTKITINESKNTKKSLTNSHKNERQKL